MSSYSTRKAILLLGGVVHRHVLFVLVLELGSFLLVLLGAINVHLAQLAMAKPAENGASYLHHRSVFCQGLMYQAA